MSRVIDERGADAFPTEAIEETMGGMGKSLRFDPQTVDELVNSAYGQADTFGLLSIVYGHVDPSKSYHVDHIFPRDKLRRDRLRDAGYDGDQIERIIKQLRDSLANLQLLPGGENIGKSERLPLDWHATGTQAPTPFRVTWSRTTYRICPKGSAASWSSMSTAGRGSGTVSSRSWGGSPAR